MKPVLVLTLLLPALAHADETRVATAVIEGPPGSDLDAPPGPPPPEVPPAPVEELRGLAARAVMVGAQQGLVTGTALTVPEGKVEIALRTALPLGGLLSLAGGLTSTTELWVDAGRFGEDSDDLATYAVGLKQVVGGGTNAQLAVTGSLRSVKEGGGDDLERIASLGAVVSLSSDGGGLTVSGGLTGMTLLDDSGDAVLLGTVGVSMGSQTTRMLAEVVRLHDEGTVGFLGLRLGNAKAALDVGTVVAPEEGFIPLPLLSFRGRM
jgi:hypothetical protein